MRISILSLSIVFFVTYYNASQDVSRVLDILDTISKHEVWQVRNAVAHFLRCFQGCHKFLFTELQTSMARNIILAMLSDERKEVSNAAMSALTGLLASCPTQNVATMVEKHIQKANGIVQRRRKTKKTTSHEMEKKDSHQTTIVSVLFMCGGTFQTLPYTCLHPKGFGGPFKAFL